MCIRDRLAIVYNGLGEDDKAIPFLIKAMEYYKREKGETDSDYAASLNKLAKVYESLGLYLSLIHISEPTRPY